MLLLIACSSGGRRKLSGAEAAADAAGTVRRTADGRLCRRPAGQRADPAGAPGPGCRLSGVAGAPAGFGRDPEAAVRRRLGRPPGPNPLPDRSQHLCGAAGAGGGQPAERQGERRRRPNRGQPLCAARQNAGDLPAGLYRRGRPGAAGRSVGGAEQRHTPRGPGQHALHSSAGADQRTDRTVQCHRRRAGYRQPDRSADDHHPARPGLCRCPAVGGRSPEASPGAGAGRGSADHARRSG